MWGKDKETPAQQATRYAMEVWQRSHKMDNTPPLELTESIVQAVKSLGYTRKLVENLITAWGKQHPIQPTP